MFEVFCRRCFSSDLNTRYHVLFAVKCAANTDTLVQGLLLPSGISEKGLAHSRCSQNVLGSRYRTVRIADIVQWHYPTRRCLANQLSD